MGYQFCCDADGDGNVVSWFLDGGTATMTTHYFSCYEGFSMGTDINQSGQVLGGSGCASSFYGKLGPTIARDLDAPFNFTIHHWEKRQHRYRDFSEAKLLRVNDYGQVLGFAYVWLDESEGLYASHIFVLSPDGAPVPNPEPSTWLLFGGGLAAVWWRRMRGARTSTSLSPDPTRKACDRSS